MRIGLTGRCLVTNLNRNRQAHTSKTVATTIDAAKIGALTE
jgi:hypothetical protein